MGLFDELRKTLGYKPNNIIDLMHFKYYGVKTNKEMQKEDFTYDRGKWVLKTYATNSMRLELISTNYIGDYDVISANANDEGEYFLVRKRDDGKELFVSIDHSNNIAILKPSGDSYEKVLVFTNNL